MLVWRRENAGRPQVEEWCRAEDRVWWEKERAGTAWVTFIALKRPLATMWNSPTGTNDKAQSSQELVKAADSHPSPALSLLMSHQRDLVKSSARWLQNVAMYLCMYFRKHVQNDMSRWLGVCFSLWTLRPNKIIFTSLSYVRIISGAFLLPFIWIHQIYQTFSVTRKIWAPHCHDGDKWERWGV